jgi:hypothetical protein
MKPSEIEGNCAPDYHKKSKVVQPVADFSQRTLTGSLHAPVKMSITLDGSQSGQDTIFLRVVIVGIVDMTANRIESALRSVCTVRSRENAWISLHGEKREVDVIDKEANNRLDVCWVRVLTYNRHYHECQHLIPSERNSGTSTYTAGILIIIVLHVKNMLMIIMQARRPNAAYQLSALVGPVEYIEMRIIRLI